MLVNVDSFVTGIFVERQSQRRSNLFAPILAVYAQTAVEIFGRDGQAALAAYLERVERASSIRAVLFDERGAEVSGRPVPAGAQELPGRVNEGAPFIFDFPHQPPPQERRPLAAQAVRSPRGALYTMVAQLPRPEGPEPPPRLGEPGSFRFGLRLLAQRLLPVLLIGALFCYLLARHLTTPIVKLRDTTQALADGRLSARMSDRLVRR